LQDKGIGATEGAAVLGDEGPARVAHALAQRRVEAGSGDGRGEGFFIGHCLQGARFLQAMRKYIEAPALLAA
jgi:hypothetical protein